MLSQDKPTLREVPNTVECYYMILLLHKRRGLIFPKQKAFTSLVLVEAFRLGEPPDGVQDQFIADAGAVI